MTQTIAGTDVLDELQQGEPAWAVTPLSARIELLSELQASVADHAQAWVETAAAIKQLPPGSPLRGEEWISGPFPIVGSAAALRDTLTALERGASPVDGRGAR